MPWNTRALSSTTKSDYNDETLHSLSTKKKAMPQLTRTSRQLRHRLHFWFGRCPHETLQNPSGYFELSMSFYVASSKCYPMPAFFAQCSWCAIVMRLFCFPKNWKPPFFRNLQGLTHEWNTIVKHRMVFATISTGNITLFYSWVDALA